MFDIAIALNVLTLLLGFFELWLSRKRLLTFSLILAFYVLWFPIGFIRLLAGYPSLIGYDMFHNPDNLVIASLIALIGLISFICGARPGDLGEKIQYPEYKAINQNGSSYAQRLVKFSIFILMGISLFLIVNNFRQYDIIDYFVRINYYRQIAHGYMPVYLSLFCISMLASYLYIIQGRAGLMVWFSYLYICAGFFMYGYRGPILIVLLFHFFVFQKVTNFRPRLTLYRVMVLLLLVTAFIIAQVMRDYSVIVETGKMSTSLEDTLLVRFFGLEVITRMVEVLFSTGHHFSFMPLLNACLEIIEFPFPRDVLFHKIDPVGIRYAAEFFNFGRGFDTGGIAPTVLGELVWLFGLPGILFMYLFGYISKRLDFSLLRCTSPRQVLLRAFLMVYCVQAVEAPINYVGVLYMYAIAFGFLGVLIYCAQWWKNLLNPLDLYSSVK